MRWFVDSSLSPAVVAALVRHGQTAVPAPGEGIESISLAQLDVITADVEIIDRLLLTGKFKRSIVRLSVGPGEVEQDDAVERLFQRYKRLTPGRLYTVSEKRVKIRQLPTKSAV